MHILIACDRPLGGVPIVMIDLARGLVSKGHHVTLLASPEDGRELLETAIAAGVHHQAWSGPSGDGRGPLGQLIAKSEPRWDIILSAHRGCDIATGWYCYRSRLPHVIAVHGDPSYEHHGTSFPRLRNFLWRTVMRRAARVTAISKFIALRVHAFAGQSLPVEVIHNANSRYEPSTSPAAVREPGKPLRLVACGRLYDAKRPELCFPLMAALRQLGVDCRLDWIGDGDMLPALRAQASASELPIHFLGHREDPWDALREAHLLIHFCGIEGFGLAIVEALSAGLPVIAFRSGAIPEIIRDDREGYLVHDGDVAAMADRVVSIGNDATLHQRLSQAALQRANAFRSEAMTDHYINLFTQIAKHES